MKKINKILTNVLLGALTLSSLGLAIVQAEETVASVTIEDGIIEHTNNTTALTFDGPRFSFETYFGNSPLTTPAAVGNEVKLEVNDQRSLNGITDGWKVTAKLSQFKNSNNQPGAKSLGQNTYISLSSAEVIPTLGTTYEEGAIAAPTVFKTEDNNNIKLFANDTSEILIWSAKRGENNSEAVGVDKWSLTFPAENISLTIQNDELVGGEHEATITWVFSDTFAVAEELED